MFLILLAAGLLLYLAGLVIMVASAGGAVGAVATDGPAVGTAADTAVPRAAAASTKFVLFGRGGLAMSVRCGRRRQDRFGVVGCGKHRRQIRSESGTGGENDCECKQSHFSHFFLLNEWYQLS